MLSYETVENYPGFPEGVGAFDLAELIRTHSLKFGLQARNAEVGQLQIGNLIKEIHLADGNILYSKTVILASGASPNKLGVKGETEFTGRGVSYCAVCDAPFYRNQEIAVVGGGDTALEEAIYLSKFADRVHVIHRRDRLRAIPIIQNRAAENDKISLVLNAVVTEIQGGPQGVEGLILRDTKDSRVWEFPINGVFVLVGVRPNGSYLPLEIDRDALGFVRTDQEMATSVPGVFAAGDLRQKRLRQIVTAVGDGATAAFSAGQYIEEHFHHIS